MSVAYPGWAPPVTPRQAILAFVAALVACSEATNGTGMISQRIGETARTPASREVDLSQLTTFGWDRVYATKPGVSREEVCKFIGAGRNRCGRIIRIERAPEDHMYLVFALNGQLTHIELHAVANGQFDPPLPESGLPKGDAVFRVRHVLNGSTDTLWLAQR